MFQTKKISFPDVKFFGMFEFYRTPYEKDVASCYLSNDMKTFSNWLIIKKVIIK